MGRRKVDIKTLDYAPDVQVDCHLSSIASVRSAVEAACLDEGTTFKSMGNFDYDAFYTPLLMITSQMKALMWAVDRWAFRAKVSLRSCTLLTGRELIAAISICNTSTKNLVSPPLSLSCGREFLLSCCCFLSSLCYILGYRPLTLIP